MATLTIPKPDDNEYLKDIGMNYMSVTNNTVSEAAWREGETFRWMNFTDFVGDDDSQSTGRRIYDQVKSKNVDRGDTMEVGGEIDYFNSITGESEKRTGDLLTAEQANDKYGLNGRLNFNRDLTTAEAQIMHERKIEEMKYQFVMQQAEGIYQKYVLGIGYRIAKLMDDQTQQNSPANIGRIYFLDPDQSRQDFYWGGLKYMDINDFIKAVQHSYSGCYIA